jgi:hypothetical protein
MRANRSRAVDHRVVVVQDDAGSAASARCGAATRQSVLAAGAGCAGRTPEGHPRALPGDRGAGQPGDLLQAPVAGDLRFLLSVLRILPDLERSHHSVVEIASRANHILGEDLSPRCRGLVERMGDLASGMWRRAADSWYQRDRSAAAELAGRDEMMDELRASLIGELASGRMTLPVAIDMGLVARFYERLADHAVNIARRVGYLAGSATD